MFNFTSENDQQFMVALRFAPDVTEAPEMAMKDLSVWISRALPSYYCSKDIALNILSREQAAEIQRLKESNAQFATKVIELQQDVINQQSIISNFEKQLANTNTHIQDINSATPAS